MKKTVLLLLVNLMVFAAQAAEEQNSTSFFSRKQKTNDSGVELYQSNSEMRQYKRFGVGLSMLGYTGLAGIHTEYNLDSTNALVVAVGTGPAFGTMSALYKNNFEGLYFSPFAKLGYSKWFSAAGTNGGATNSDVLTQLFSQNDLRNQRFEADFLVASFGMEYTQLEAEWAGVTFFGEVSLLNEFKRGKSIPVGSLGITYFY